MTSPGASTRTSSSRSTKLYVWFSASSDRSQTGRHGAATPQRGTVAARLGAPDVARGPEESEPPVKRQTAAAVLLALVLTVAGCSSSAPKDSAPVALPPRRRRPQRLPRAETLSRPVGHAGASRPRRPTSSRRLPRTPRRRRVRGPGRLQGDARPRGPHGPHRGRHVRPGINDLMTAFETGDKAGGRRVPHGRDHRLRLTRTEIEERRASMTEEDLDVLVDFIDLCGRSSPARAHYPQRQPDRPRLRRRDRNP